MIQDPNPIDPKPTGTIELSVDGVRYPFPVETIEPLFCAYVAALRAEYYASVDAARCDDQKTGNETFDASFIGEIRHAMRDRSEIAGWMSNNMDVHQANTDAIGVRYIQRKQP